VNILLAKLFGEKKLIMKSGYMYGRGICRKEVNRKSANTNFTLATLIFFVRWYVNYFITVCVKSICMLSLAPIP
jgi:hypothetical protein